MNELMRAFIDYLEDEMREDVTFREDGSYQILTLERPKRTHSLYYDSSDEELIHNIIDKNNNQSIKHTDKMNKQELFDRYKKHINGRIIAEDFREMNNNVQIVSE